MPARSAKYPRLQISKGGGSLRAKRKNIFGNKFAEASAAGKDLHLSGLISFIMNLRNRLAD
jgi:hypothetical protein